MEAKLVKAWERLQIALVFTKEALLFQLDEYEKMRAAGFSAYWESAQPRLADWWTARSEQSGGFDEDSEDETYVQERSKKSQVAANRIKQMREAQSSGGGAAKGASKKPA